MRMQIEKAGARAGRATLGLLLALAGAAGLSGLVLVTNCTAAACERAMFAVGLAGGSLLLGVSQVAVLVGLWLLWRAARPGR